jgi:TPR repeat protein
MTPRRYGRLVFAVVVLAALGVLGVVAAYRRQEISSWYRAFTRPHRPAAAAPAPEAEQPAATSSPAPSAASEPAAPGQQSGAGMPPSTQPANAVDQSAVNANQPPAKTELPGGASTEQAGREPAAKAQPPKEKAAANRPKTASEKAKPAADKGDELLAKGKAYLYGDQSPRNCQQALNYLNKAAELGNAGARSQLGAMYATGHCVPLDRVRAYGWFSLAADVSGRNNDSIQRSRKMLWNEMTPEEQALARQQTTH